MGSRNPRMRRWSTVALAAVPLLGVSLLTACSGSANAPTGATSTTTAPASGGPAASFDASAVGRATVSAPITGGTGKITLGPGGLDLASVGYTETEFFIAGKATTYDKVGPLRSFGRWQVKPGTEATYRTRIVVRRPKDDAAFNGTVAVEWFNVSGGLDAAPDWTFSHVELIRSGWAWVGVSAQRVGIEGGTGGPGDALALKTADPERYGSLDHPGDNYSYDMFSQAGAAVREQADVVLGGLTPKRILAIGESQSAFRLTTYVNAIQPISHVFDGYLIHSRAAAGAPLSGKGDHAVTAPDPTFIRTDLDVPVFVLSTESDLVGDRLGYERARQQDTDRFRSWEIAGASHVDAYGLGIGDSDDGTGVADKKLFAAMLAPPASVYGGVITCDVPINAGPQTYVVRAAIAALNRWVRTGKAPATSDRLLLDTSRMSYQLDENGNAEGGLRLPQVDAPIALLSGLGQSGDSFCGLFGTTKPFNAKAFAAANTDRETWLVAWNRGLDEAVQATALLAADAKRLKEIAAASTVGS